MQRQRGDSAHLTVQSGTAAGASLLYIALGNSDEWRSRELSDALLLAP